MTMFYDYLLTLLTPFIYLTGRIGLPHRKVTGAHYFKYRDKINIGTVMLTKTNWEVSNLTNPCELKHAAIYVGNIYGDEIKYVLESTRKGVVLTNLVDFLLNKDVVVGVSFKKVYGQVPRSVLMNVVLKLKGIEYDYKFTEGSKALYCFETCVVFINYIFPVVKLKEREILKSKKIYDHTTFLDEEVFNIDFDSRKDLFDE